MNLKVLKSVFSCVLTYQLVTCVIICLVSCAEGSPPKTETRTKQLLQNIRSHLAAQVEEVLQQKECDTGLTLCEPNKSEEEEEDEDDDESEEIPPPPKVRGHHKPLIKVYPKEVIQTMIHKAHKPLIKKPDPDKEPEGTKPKRLKISGKAAPGAEDEDDDDDKKSKGKAKTKLQVRSGAKKDEDREEFPDDIHIFAATYTSVQNAICRKHSRVYLRQLKRYKLWALMMYDSSAKLPSGILQGNINQYGDFDQCLSVNAIFKDSSSKKIIAPDGFTGIEGKYCLASIDVTPVAENAGLSQAVYRSQAFAFFKSSIDDPSHFIPKFTTVSWALCVPSSCHARDVEKAVQEGLESYNETSGLMFNVRVERDMCQVKEDVKFSFDFMAFLTILFYLSIMGLAGYATYKDLLEEVGSSEASEQSEDVVEDHEEKPSQDEKKESEGEKVEEVVQEKEEKEETEVGETKEESAAETEGETEIKKSSDKLKRIMMAFSLKRTVNQLLSDEISEDDIDCVHGLRAIATFMLYLTYRVIPLAFTPYTNRILLTQTSNEATSVILRASFMYTDCFLLLSGVLAAYSLSAESPSDIRRSWIKRTYDRFIRLVPPLLSILLFYSYVFEHIGSGPLWSGIVKKNAEICQGNMWKNLFFIQNFFSFDSMCAPHSYQLAVDMQLTLLTPLLIYALNANAKIGYGVLGALFFTSSISRYWVTSGNELSLIIYHGMPVSQIYDTWDLLSSQTLCRSTPYIIGVALGYFLQHSGRDLTFSKPFVAMGWIGAFCFGFLTIVTPAHLADRNYQYDLDEAAQFATLSPIAWSLTLAWIVFACFTGYSGKVNEILSHKILLVFSRISYSFYLSQFIVFFYRIGIKRVPERFSLFTSVHITELVVIIAISTLVTLLFELPMQEIGAILMECFHRTPTAEEESEEAVEGEKEENAEEAPEEEIADENKEPEELELEEFLPDEAIPEEIEEADEEFEQRPLRRFERISFHEDIEDEVIGGEKIKGEDFWGQDED